MRPPGPSKEYCRTVNYAIDEAKQAQMEAQEFLDSVVQVKEHFPDAQLTGTPGEFTSASLSVDDCRSIVWDEERKCFLLCVRIGCCHVFALDRFDRVASASAYNLALPQVPGFGKLLEAVKEHVIREKK